MAGWAIENGRAPADLTAWVNGTPVTRFKPSLARPDVTGFPRNDVGFDVDLGRVLNAGDVVGVTNQKGEHLARSPRRAAVSEWSRDEKALYLMDRRMKILEIGPGPNPLTPRSEGWNSFSLDHATQEELRIKYRGQYPVERIGPVDFVWKGGPIETAIRAADHKTFDAIIASHVIEHIPDPIAFFLSASAILKPGGLISLIIPDKRFIFDFFKSLTLTSDYLYAHHLRRTRHTKKTVFDNMALNVYESGDLVWATRPMGNFTFFLGDDALARAKRGFDEAVEDESGEYVDYHTAMYTPSSFALIMFELGQLQIIPFQIERSFPTSGCEFYVTLRNVPPKQLTCDLTREERLRLMKATVRELSEQGRWLLDDDSST